MVLWSFGSSRGSSWISRSARGTPSAISAILFGHELNAEASEARIPAADWLDVIDLIGPEKVRAP